MYYINPDTFFNQPDADLKIMLAQAAESPPGTKIIKKAQRLYLKRLGKSLCVLADYNNSEISTIERKMSHIESV